MKLLNRKHNEIIAFSLVFFILGFMFCLYYNQTYNIIYENKIVLSDLVVIIITVVFGIYLTSILNKKSTLRIEVIKDFLKDINDSKNNIKGLQQIIENSNKKISNTNFNLIQFGYNNNLKIIEQLINYFELFDDFGKDIGIKFSRINDIYEKSYDLIVGNEFSNKEYNIKTIENIKINFQEIYFLFQEIKQILVSD